MNQLHWICRTAVLLLMPLWMPFAHAAELSFGQRLGWQGDQVIVLLHIDDVGMSRSSNLGAIESVEHGVANSWSVMMPCPWVPQIAHYLQDHPDVDSGLHLTLTSEWKLYRWGPVAGKARVPGLVDPEGCLWRDIPGVVAKATPAEIEIEIRAQIDRAESLGMPITHLDSHMGTLFERPDFFATYAKIGIEKGIPILAVGGHSTYMLIENGDEAQKLHPWISKIWNAGLPVLDDLHTGSYDWKPAEKTEKLLALLAELKPGVTEILFHSSLPTEDFPFITGSSESRRADMNALKDPRVRELIRQRGIVLTTWKELLARRKKAGPMAE